jgi:ArsR family transcriptional regulator
MNTRTTTGIDVCEVEYVDDLRVREARRQAKSPEAVSLFAETFKLLGDPTRVRIAHALSCNELCVCDLAMLLGVSQSAVSHSLRSLRQLRLVRYRREGKIAYYSLDDDHIRQLLEIGFEHVRELASEQFERVGQDRAKLYGVHASKPDIQPVGEPRPKVARRRRVRL